MLYCWRLLVTNIFYKFLVIGIYIPTVIMFGPSFLAACRNAGGKNYTLRRLSDRKISLEVFTTDCIFGLQTCNYLIHSGHARSVLNARAISLVHPVRVTYDIGQFARYNIGQSVHFRTL